MPPPAEYSPRERALLLQTAHRAIEAAFATSKPPTLPEDLPATLKEPRGAFTTLHVDGQLRGCVGYVIAKKPLIETAAETAIAAAFPAPRSPSLPSTDAQREKIETSVLPLPHPTRPEEIIAGVHGLIVSLGTRR